MKIKDYLSKKSPVDFASTIGITAAALSQYKSGRRIPRPSIARRIVEATGGQVTYEDLYGVPELNKEKAA